MIVQKANASPVLYLVPTPIGNFQDMTYRAVEVLKSVDLIYAEDTRVTKVLLSHFNINTPLHSYHIFNEKVQSETILEDLQNNKNIALVSDAGLPGISDPGYLIVREAIAAGFAVVSLPGANAALTALIASGLPCERFFFVGFLNSRSGQREKELQKLLDYPETLIFYEAPHRIAQTLASMYKVFGERKVVIARELTKRYEEYIRGNLSEVVAANLEIKGEIVILVEGTKKTATQEMLNQIDLQEHFRHYLEQGYPEKEAMKAVAKDRELSKSEIYKQIKI
jgi:16S rRNA (cytidine1402-2'-O)-methyltransferase